MLSPAERREIDEELAQVPVPRAACIEALKVVQARRGWVDDAALADVAGYLGLSVHELEGVASFYNLIYRRPVGRHVILFCDSVSCWILEGQKLLSKIRQAAGVSLGETSEDGRFTLLPIACLGACERAPALMIDEDLHGDLAPQDIPSLLDGYR